MKTTKSYMAIGIDDLVIYSVFKLLDTKEESTVERIVKECFMRFPERFSMARYSQWPDSKRLHSSLMRCRDKGWITGNAKSGFQLTEFGKNMARKTERRLKPQLEFEMIDLDRQTKDKKRGEKWDIIRNYLKNSKLYEEYRKDAVYFSPDEKDIRKMLMCTLETPIRIVRQNLINSVEISKEFKDRELFNFLIICARELRIKLDKIVTRF